MKIWILIFVLALASIVDAQITISPGVTKFGDLEGGDIQRVEWSDSTANSHLTFRITNTNTGTSSGSSIELGYGGLGSDYAFFTKYMDTNNTEEDVPGSAELSVGQVGDLLFTSNHAIRFGKGTYPGRVDYGQFGSTGGFSLNGAADEGIGNLNITGSYYINGNPISVSHSVTLVVDGSGIVLGTGTKNPVKVPFGGTLQGWTTMCKPSCSITMDILRAADGAGLPVTSIVGGGGTKPSIASNVENSSTSFTGWTSTTLTAKDNLAISLSGITAATYVEITLYYQ